MRKPAAVLIFVFSLLVWASAGPAELPKADITHAREPLPSFVALLGFLIPLVAMRARAARRRTCARAERRLDAIGRAQRPRHAPKYRAAGDRRSEPAGGAASRGGAAAAPPRRGGRARSRDERRLPRARRIHIRRRRGRRGVRRERTASKRMKRRPRRMNSSASSKRRSGG
jgi:hypothetical protein